MIFWQLVFFFVVICNLDNARAITLKENASFRIRGESQETQRAEIRNWYDRNGDGYLDLKDVKLLLDLNGDGFFNAHELKELWKRIHILVRKAKGLS